MRGDGGSDRRGERAYGADIAPAVLDAGLIAAAQKVEHYEMASYGTIRSWAEQLGLQQATELLRETYEEEKQTDEKLTQLAKEGVNAKAGAETQGGRGGERQTSEARTGKTKQPTGGSRGGQNGNSGRQSKTRREESP